MRVSVNSDDVGYTGPIPGIEIRFNGDAIKDVITADEETGYILRYQRNGDDFVLNDDGNEILTEELRGKVEVIMPLAHG